MTRTVASEKQEEAIQRMLVLLRSKPKQKKPGWRAGLNKSERRRMRARGETPPPRTTRPKPKKKRVIPPASFQPKTLRTRP